MVRQVGRLSLDPDGVGTDQLSTKRRSLRQRGIDLLEIPPLRVPVIAWSAGLLEAQCRTSPEPTQEVLAGASVGAGTVRRGASGVW